MKTDRVAFDFSGRPDVLHIDFHGIATVNAYDRALRTLVDAHRRGLAWVVFTHGSSTSRPGKTTCRSEVRRLLRGKDATPYIVRREIGQNRSTTWVAIQHTP